MRFKDYYQLTKPGIIYGNLLTAAAGFLLASKGHVRLWLMLTTLAGTSLVIASACVFNNYIDRSIDIKMARTKKRALVEGTISGRSALIFATLLGILGFLVLILATNVIVVCIGLIAFLFYIVLYGIGKRRSIHGTIVGSVPGAAPVVAGYCAVTGRIDAAAILIFLVLIFWQMPHFYSIAMYRYDDYSAAGLPVLPVKKGMRHAKIQILCYIIAFIVTSLLLSVFGYTGWIYAICMAVLGLIWFIRGLRSFGVADDRRWGRKMFLFSLIVITGFSVLISVGPLLP